MKKISLIISVLNSFLSYSDHDWKKVFEKLNELEVDLLRAILSNHLITDEEAAKHVFNTDFKDLNYQRYRKSLTDKLTTEILFFKPSARKYSTYQRVKYKCEQLYAILKLLRGTPHRQLAKSIASRLISKARKYHFTEIRIGANEYLVYHYSFIDPQRTQVDHYYQDLMHSTEIRKAELFAESNYNLLASYFNKGNYDKTKLLNQAKKTKEELDRYSLQKENSNKFLLNYFSFCVLMNEGDDNFKSALNYAQEGYQFTQELSFNHKKAKVLFLVHLTNNYLRLGHISEAHQTVSKSLKIQNEGTNNWFTMIWLLVQIEIFKKNYDKAASFYKEMISHKSFNRQPKYRKNQFVLGGGALHYLHGTNRISTFGGFDKGQLDELIEDIFEYDQSKSSTNIPLLISKLLFELLNSNTTKIKEIINQLDQYSSPKIRSSNAIYRTNSFIKLLKCIPDGYYNPKAIRRRSNKIMPKLSNVDFKISNEKTILEIIPYEHLWEMILEDLESNKIHNPQRLH